MSKIEVNEIDAQSGSTITVGSACKSVVVPGNVVKTNAVQASDAGNIISQSGTTITLGASGDTINLASGASQSGFGREGSVNWQTGSIKTSTFTAASGEGYFCNTTGLMFKMQKIQKQVLFPLLLQHQVVQLQLAEILKFIDLQDQELLQFVQ